MGLPGISKEMDLKNVLAKKVRFDADLVRE